MTEIQTEPLDRSELKPCALCGKGVLHTGAPFFYELTIAQCVADLSSIRQQHGLELMLGAAAPLAAVLVPSTTVARRMPASRVLVCSECALNEARPPAFFIDEDDTAARTKR